MKADPGHEFVSTKTYTHSVGLTCAFRQWRADSHCHFLHGYPLSFRFEFTGTDLDVRNWLVDFGSLKTLKGILEDTFDHKTIVAEDDPQMAWFEEGHRLGILDMVVVPSTGCEMTAYMAFEVAAQHLIDAGYGDRVELQSVEVAEHEGNSAMYRKAKVNEQV